MKRIGIFSGSFDPVHQGHVAFALQAAEAAELDYVYFAPEIKPRRKTGVTHFAHRVEMLKLAVATDPKLKVLELPDKQFSAIKTIPRLKKLFPGAELFFICGADILEHMPSWPHIKVFLSSFGLVVGVRDKELDGVKKLLAKLPELPLKTFTIRSQLPDISSRQLRQTIASHKKTHGLLPNTAEYINTNWLYQKLP